MKRSYQSPQIAVERFVLSQQITSCAGVRINSMDSICVLTDGGAPDTMIDLANAGYFLAEGLCHKFAADGDGICYNTSSSMAFTS